jgi:DNA-binding transcriptional regulator YiaG
MRAAMMIDLQPQVRLPMRQTRATISIVNTPSEVDRVLELQEWIRTGRARAVRVHLGISQRMAAREIGVHPSAVVRWEGGSSRPRGPKALAYHEFLCRLINHTR